MASTNRHDTGVLRCELTDLHALLEHLLFRLQEATGSFQFVLRADRPQERRAGNPHSRSMNSHARSDQELHGVPSAANKRRSIHQLMLELHCLNTRLGTFLMELEQHLQVGSTPTEEEDQQEE